MKQITKSTSTEEVMEKPIYLVMCSTTIVDRKGKKEILGRWFFGLHKSKNEAHYYCRDSYFYANYLCEEWKVEDEDFYFETDDNELTITTNLFKTMGLIYKGDPNAKLLIKYEVIELML